MDEASAIARLQGIALTAAKALQPTGIPAWAHLRTDIKADRGEQSDG